VPTGKQSRTALLLYTAEQFHLPLFPHILGVGIATASGTIFINVASMILVRGKPGLRWWNARFLGWLAPTTASIGVGVAILHAGIDFGAVLVVTLIGIYASFGLVLFVQGFNDDERDLIHYIANRILVWTAG
jgi:hypothetical protein